MERKRVPPAGVTADPVSGGISPQEQAVLNAIRETPFGAIEVVMHQSRIVQIVRTEKMKVDEETPRG